MNPEDFVPQATRDVDALGLELDEYSRWALIDHRSHELRIARQLGRWVP